MLTSEINYAGDIMLIGELKLLDDSFDHEFGVKKQFHYEVENFSVLAWVEGLHNWLDITKSLNEKQLEEFKKYFLEQMNIKEAS